MKGSATFVQVMEEKGFVVSALKYRPAEWDEVVGQNAISSTLKNAIASEEIAKAYLFCGPRGVGKTTSARIFAKAINSKYIEEGTDLSFNVFELDAASNNSVDDIRQLIDQVRISPQLGKYKVYIIDEVHMLSTQAFNAFLKTLEEPPPHAIFILATTEKHKVLPTILSRCQIYDFQRIQVRDMVAHLARIANDQNVQFEEQALHLIATKADGALRDALSLFDQMVSFTGKNLSYAEVAKNLNVLDYDYFRRITKAFIDGDVASALMIYDEIQKKGFDSLLFMIGLAGHLRNLLVAKDQGTVSLLDCPDKVKQDYIDQSMEMQASELISHLSELQKAEVNYRASKNKRLLTEVTLMKLCTSHGILAEGLEKKKPSKPELKPSPSPSPASPQVTAPAASIPNPTPAPSPVPAPSPAPAPQAVSQSQVVVEKVEPAPVVAPAPSPEPIAVKESPTPVPSPAPVKVKASAEAPPVQSATVVAEPAPISPASAAAPAVSPKGRRRRSISLADLDEVEEKQEKTESSEEGGHIEGKSIDKEKLMVAWKAYAEIIQEQNKFSFHSTLNNRSPEILDDHTIRITLENDVQLETLNQEKAELMSYVREKLDHPGIHLEARIDIEDKGNMVFRTPKEQLMEMMEKNPTLRKMSQQFDLDLDY